MRLCAQQLLSIYSSGGQLRKGQLYGAWTVNICQCYVLACNAQRCDCDHFVPAQKAAKAGMQQAMQQNQLSGLQRVAQLLSGHQTAAAAVLAASIGNVRLASLIAQVS